MFDIGWLELLVIGMVALIVVGPKDLPGMFRTVGQFVGKARGMAREFQRSMEAAADESGIKDAADSMKGLDALGQAQSSMKDYAKNYVTQKDQKSAGEALVEEATKIASPAAKATAPVKEAVETASKAPAKKPAAKKSAAKKPAAPKTNTSKSKSSKTTAAKKPTPKKSAQASKDVSAKS